MNTNNETIESWIPRHYNECTWRRRADYIARIVEGENYDANDYMVYYMNPEYGYIQWVPGVEDTGRMADFEELPGDIQIRIAIEIRRQAKE